MSDVSTLGLKRTFNLNPELSYTLPASWYFDPAIFEREKEAIFFKTWHYVGHAESVDEPGSYMTGRVVDQGIVVTRAYDGALHAFYNVCMHRASELVTGRGRGRYMTCPYHGWKYDCAGRLVSALGQGKVAGFDPREFDLVSIQVEEFARMIFVNLDPEAPSLHDQAGMLEKELRHFVPDLDDLSTVHEEKHIEIKANWKAVVENFLECYHCPATHPDLLDAVDYSTFYAQTYEYYGCFRPLPKEETEDEIQGGCYDVLWPTTMITIFPGRSNYAVMNVLPVGPERTLETWDFFGRMPPTEEDLEGIRLFGFAVNEQDISRIEAVQRGVHSRAYLQGRFMIDKERSMVSEHPAHHFDSLVMNALEGTRRLPVQAGARQFG